MDTIRRLTADEVRRAEEFWAEYQTRHDVTALRGQAVVIDGQNGRVWFGRDGVAATKAAWADGCDVALLLLRVGSPYYQRKGGGRR